jgi:hypothetical protein
MSHLIEVDLFWDGDGWYYANKDSSERLGGPIELIHDAWKQADTEGLRVVRVATTRGNRGYRKT